MLDTSLYFCWRYIKLKSVGTKHDHIRFLENLQLSSKQFEGGSRNPAIACVCPHKKGMNNTTMKPVVLLYWLCLFWIQHMMIKQLSCWCRLVFTRFLAKIVCGFPQSLQENAGVVPCSGYSHFLPSLSQLISILPSDIVLYIVFIQKL